MDRNGKLIPACASLRPKSVALFFLTITRRETWQSRARHPLNPEGMPQYLGGHSFINWQGGCPRGALNTKPHTLIAPCFLSYSSFVHARVPNVLLGSWRYYGDSSGTDNVIWVHTPRRAASSAIGCNRRRRLLTITSRLRIS